MKVKEIRGSGLLRLPQLLQRIPFSRPTIDRLERRGLFPKRRHEGRIVFWIEAEVDIYLANLASRETARGSRDQSTVSA
jgi:predicted DNA-binding transcriptional regulator AlpA